MQKLDELRLSQYVDGELNPLEVTQVTESLQQDEASRDYLVKLVGLRARMKSMGASVMEEDVPASLINHVQPDSGRTKTDRGWYSQVVPLRYAAMLVLFIASFFLGSKWSDSSKETPFFPLIPAALEQVVHTTLEFSPSGQRASWTDEHLGLQAHIEPLKTFRGNDGRYYRLYLLEMTGGDEGNLPYVGLAVRTGNEHWQTRSFYLQNERRQI